MQKTTIIVTIWCIILLISSGCRSDKPLITEKMKWWKDARFGMFIHWGIYSVPAGIYNGEEVPGIGEWIMNTAKIPVKEYEEYARKFNPTEYDAEEWVRIAKEAGMKYIIITSKHHDGFAMYHSNASSFNIYDATPFKRDPLMELAAACEKYNMRLGFYYSQAQDWHHPGGTASGGHWDSLQNGNMDEYIDSIAVPQIKEILSKYGKVSVLWWDTPVGMSAKNAEKLLPLLDLQPGIITNDRLCEGYPGDLETPEQHIPETGIPGKNWETCMTMNDTWGYKSYDQNWKSTETLVRNLIDIASKGGNYLLNVGPTSFGQIPDSSIIRLKEIGAWMDINSEAIYGTEASPFKNLEWGRCTQKPNKRSTTLYFHLFDFPENKVLIVSGLHNPIKKVYALADKDKKRLPFKLKRADISIDLNDVTRTDYATVLVMEIQGAPEVYNSPEITPSTEIFIDSINIKISSDLPDAKIRYTINGNEPDLNSPLYNKIIKLSPNDDIIIKAASFREGQILSGINKIELKKVVAINPIEVKDYKQGIRYAYYEGVWANIPDFSSLKAKKQGLAKVIDISIKDRSVDYGLAFEGYIKIPVDGVYTFFLESDDGSNLFISDSYKIDNDGQHAMIEKKVEVPLKAGYHQIAVNFFQHGGDDELLLSWKGPGFEKMPIGKNVLFH